MAFSATKRELGELYTFFRLLADGAVSPGTPKAEKDETLRWPVALIQREEHDGTRRYYIEAQEVRIVSGTTGKDGSFVPGEKEELRFPREDFGDAAEVGSASVEERFGARKWKYPKVWKPFWMLSTSSTWKQRRRTVPISP